MINTDITLLNNVRCKNTNTPREGNRVPRGVLVQTFKTYTMICIVCFLVYKTTEHRRNKNNPSNQAGWQTGEGLFFVWSVDLPPYE